MSGSSDAGEQTAREEGECKDPGGCEEALEQLEQYLDGELPETKLDTIRDHLAACYPCADRASFEEQLRVLIRDRCAERAPDSLVASIRERLKGSGG